MNDEVVENEAEDDDLNADDTTEITKCVEK